MYVSAKAHGMGRNYFAALKSNIGSPYENEHDTSLDEAYHQSPDQSIYSKSNLKTHAFMGA